ncbi:ce89ec74-8aae-4a56-9e0f-a307cb91da89 [Thermothielavioides terrestris]|uniref:Ce89ec74-8aae-4a56-9e0f-a307cb91da89 n=1 Tax=Thermothielavioides terrestris TaxID=2587410 RepID=A0A446BJR4_9PEZI|nr:ce89ec74-8aae-4a56-9e0f-a307cb91da89 [Thermothielavioides terrestris]
MTFSVVEVNAPGKVGHMLLQTRRVPQ